MSDGTCDGHNLFAPNSTFVWTSDRWNRGSSPARQEKDASGRTTAYYGANSGMWPYDTNVPRTCSYCGGVNVDDLFVLLEAGFTLEGTTKSYKAYVNGPDGKSLLPPVKFYTNHATAEQIEKLNAIGVNRG